MSSGIDIYSVVIYLSIFGSSILSMSISDHYLFSKNGKLRSGSSKIIGMLFLSIGIVIPCAFAAFRGLNVGFDISTYIIPNFRYGLNDDISFSKYISGMSVKTEILFATLLYVCSKIGSIRLLFFVIQLLIIVPVAIALIKTAGKKSLALGFTVYYFLFYNFSLSGMRQSIAMSFLLLVLSELFQRKYKRSVVLLAIAQLFHSSVILIILLIGICALVYHSKHTRTWTVVCVTGLIATLFVFSFFENHIIRLVSAVSNRYAYYARIYLHNGYKVSDLYTVDLLCKTLIAIIPLFMISFRTCLLSQTQIGLIISFYKKSLESNLLSSSTRHIFCFQNNPGQALRKIYTMVIAFVLLGRYFVVFNGVFYEAMRIAFYFDLFLVVYLPLSQKKIGNRSNKLVIGVICSGLAVAYWLYFIMYIGGYGTNLVTFNV